MSPTVPAVYLTVIVRRPPRVLGLEGYASIGSAPTLVPQGAQPYLDIIPVNG